MAGDPSIDPAVNFVPMHLYLDDRRELRKWLGAVDKDVKAIRSTLDREHGSEVAEEAASTALERRRTSRGQFVRDTTLVFAGASLAIFGRVVTVWLGFG